MQFEDAKIFVAGAEPLTTIQAAISKAAAAPGGAVLIPGSYSGTDTYTNSSNVPVLDMRGSSTSTGINVPGTLTALTISGTTKTNLQQMGVIQALGAAGAAPITGTTGGVFVTTLNVPGSSAVEQIPFTVKASGLVTLAAGTYTATIQPLLYASTTIGFTAAVANAVYSTAAVSATISSASTKTIPWMASVTMWGDSTSGLTVGTKYGGMNNGALQIQSPATAMDNPPTSVVFNTATAPLQFAAGVTLSNAAAGSVINLGALLLEV